MKNNFVLSLLVTALLSFPGISAAQSQSKTLGLKVKAKGTRTVTLSDKVGKNQFSWSSTAPLEDIVGTAEGVKGTLTFDPQDLRTLQATISADVNTFKSGNDTRDQHIKGASWLDASKHSTIEFVLSDVRNVKIEGTKASGIANGKFTMRGVSKDIAIPFTLEYLEASERTAKRAPGDLVVIHADLEIALRDFNVAGSAGTIGQKVGETIKITAKLFGSTK